LCNNDSEAVEAAKSLAGAPNRSRGGLSPGVGRRELVEVPLPAVHVCADSKWRDDVVKQGGR